MASSDENEDIFVKTDMGWLIAGIFSNLAIVIALCNIWTHLRQYHSPHLQIWTIRIIGIVPIYSLVSWISLRLPEEALYFNTVRDCYEAFVIYCFIRLMLAYGGGENNCLVLMRGRGPLPHPFPMNYCLSPMLLDATFMRRCKQGCLQFVILKPIMAIFSLIFMAFGLYDSMFYQGVLLTVYNVSYTLALYYLFLFYLASREFLKEQHIVLKFFAVKTVVFLTYWQMLAVEEWPNLTAEQGEAYNDFILCVEMFLFALLHIRAFSAADAKRSDAINISSGMVHNVGQVVSVRDILDDAYHNFMPQYQNYVQASNDTSMVPTETPQMSQKYKTKTFVSSAFKRSETVPVDATPIAVATTSPGVGNRKKSFEAEMAQLHIRMSSMEAAATVAAATTSDNTDNDDSAVSPPSR